MALYANGRAPRSALVSYRGCLASPDMARRVAWVEREYMKRNPNGYIKPNEIYRDYESQVYWKQWWSNKGQPGNAATPGYSNHGDWDVGAVDWDADNIALRTELAAQVGLVRTMMPQESWHYAVRGEPQVSLAGLNYTEIDEEDDMALSEQDKAWIKGYFDLATAQYNNEISGIKGILTQTDEIEGGATSVQGKLDYLLAWMGGGLDRKNQKTSLRYLVNKLAEQAGIDNKEDAPKE